MSPPRLVLAAADGGRHTVTPYGLYFLGRDRACELSFPADPILSARHAVIFWDGERFIIQDYKSRNGIYVDGRRVERAVLADGSRLELGGQSMVACTGDPSPITGPTLFRIEDDDPVVDRLAQLNRIACSLFLELDPGKLAGRTLRLAADLTGANRGFAVQHHAGLHLGSYPLSAVHKYETPPDPLSATYHPALVQCSSAGAVLVASRCFPGDGDPALTRPQDKTEDFDWYAVVPLHWKKDWYGMLFLARSPNKGPFGRDETTLLLPFARYAALAHRAAGRFSRT